jgi:hypothetical protein
MVAMDGRQVAAWLGCTGRQGGGCTARPVARGWGGVAVLARLPWAVVVAARQAQPPRGPGRAVASSPP